MLQLPVRRFDIRRRGRRRLRSSFALGGVPQPRENAGVSPAPADVAVQGRPYLVVGRVGVALEERDRGHHHPRRAVGTLESRIRNERLLDRVQDASDGKTLDGRHRPAGNLVQPGHARTSHGTVHQDRAGAASSLPTAVLRAGQAELLAQNVKEAPWRVRRDVARVPVDDDPGHAVNPCDVTSACARPQPPGGFDPCPATAVHSSAVPHPALPDVRRATRGAHAHKIKASCANSELLTGGAGRTQCG